MSWIIYRCTEGTSDKFWMLRKVGADDYDISWGRVGSKGQILHSVPAKMALKREREKLRKGYVLCKSTMEGLPRGTYKNEFENQDLSQKDTDKIDSLIEEMLLVISKT